MHVLFLLPYDPDPKTGTEFLSPEKGKIEQSTNTNTSASDPLQTASEFEFIIPKEKYEMVRDAMDKSEFKFATTSRRLLSVPFSISCSSCWNILFKLSLLLRILALFTAK